MSIGIKTQVIRFQIPPFPESHGIDLLSFRSLSERRPQMQASGITLMISVTIARMMTEACFQCPVLALTLRILVHLEEAPFLNPSPSSFLDQV